MKRPRHWLAPLLVTAAALIHPPSAAAQVTGEVEIRDGQGEALVRNASRSTMDVEVAIWESDESGEQVELLRTAAADLWPHEFRLEPGEMQTVRFLVKGDPYPPDTLLRLETRFIPLRAEPIAATSAPASAGARAELRIVTRIISKVWIR